MIFFYPGFAVQAPDWYGALYIIGALVPRTIDNELGVNPELPFCIVVT